LKKVARVLENPLKSEVLNVISLKTVATQKIDRAVLRWGRGHLPPPDPLVAPPPDSRPEPPLNIG